MRKVGKWNLLSWVKEATIWSLELTVTWIVVSADNCSKTHIVSLAPVLHIFFETERVNSVWAGKELGFGWITLDILPSGMRPSAWHELKIFFWVGPTGFLILLFYETIWVHCTWLKRFISVALVLASTEVFGPWHLPLILHFLSNKLPRNYTIT
jgi:hypothetical protein